MPQITFSHLVSRSYGEAITREFDAVDGKGRRFGASATPVVHVYELKTDDVPEWAVGRAKADKVGTFYGFRPHAMRDGQLYGASHGTNEFATEAERDTAMAKYFADAEKRALKNKARAS